MRKNSSGFTLVELLVVITILAILTTVGMVIYSGINKRARDSARKSDLYEVSTALEVNKTFESYMPLQVNQFSSFQWKDSAGNAYCIATGSPADPVATSLWGETCPGGFTAIAPGVPSGSFGSWKLCTFLENPDSGNLNVFCRSSSQ